MPPSYKTGFKRNTTNTEIMSCHVVCSKTLPWKKKMKVFVYEIMHKINNLSVWALKYFVKFIKCNDKI